MLFVAEKQAALQVVKKRLSEIGIGEFCLELHSGKSADKGEIIRTIENTLSLAKTENDDKFDGTGRMITDVRKSLKAPLDAMHKKRRLGCSVYEGIIYYLQNKNAPELVKYRKEGKQVFYSLEDNHIENIIKIAIAHMREEK